jgi:hypothetical protein
MYATLRLYEMTSDWDDSLVRHVDEGFVPLIEDVPGFVAYYSFEGGPRLFASFTITEDRAGADRCNRLAAEYVQKHLADRFTTPPEVTAGTVRTERGRVA